MTKNHGLLLLSRFLSVVLLGVLAVPVAAQPQLRRTLAEGHANLITSLVFSPDGKTIASASLDETIKLWNLSKKK